MATVTVRVLSDAFSPTPISGIVVQFYDTSAVFQTSGTTDVDGEVTVALPENTYDITFFKVGVTILPRQPQRVEIVDADPHEFEIEAHVREVPESTNPARCTVSGYILGVGGGRYKTSIVLRLWKELTITGGNISAMQGMMEVFSNDDGYFEFELLRNKAYVASFVMPRTLFCEDPGLIKVITPDGPSIDLHAFLFPMPVSMEFSANTISLVAGDPQDESIEYTLTYNDGSERASIASPWGAVFLQNTDNEVVEASFIEGKILLKPLTPGTATLTTTRIIPTTIDYDPLPDYVTESVVVTVT
jgi:hypothetical protein